MQIPEPTNPDLFSAPQLRVDFRKPLSSVVSQSLIETVSRLRGKESPLKAAGDYPARSPRHSPIHNPPLVLKNLNLIAVTDTPAPLKPSRVFRSGPLTTSCPSSGEPSRVQSSDQLRQHLGAMREEKCRVKWGDDSMRKDLHVVQDNFFASNSVRKRRRKTCVPRALGASQKV